MPGFVCVAVGANTGVPVQFSYYARILHLVRWNDAAGKNLKKHVWVVFRLIVLFEIGMRKFLANARINVSQ